MQQLPFLDLLPETGRVCLGGGWSWACIPGSGGAQVDGKRCFLGPVEREEACPLPPTWAFCDRRAQTPYRDAGPAHGNAESCSLQGIGSSEAARMMAFPWFLACLVSCWRLGEALTPAYQPTWLLFCSSGLWAFQTVPPKERHPQSGEFEGLVGG